MPKNAVIDPITDQEIAFARLILSGTMSDRRAAEAAGLNPSTAAYTKSKPRVRAYMIEHRAAVNEKLVHQEAEGLRNLSLSRDQILTRLWQLATLNPEQTRGSIAGQIKAMSMIVAIEGLIPDRRLSPIQAQPAEPPVQPKVYVSEAMRRRQPQPTEETRPEQVHPAAPQAPEPEPLGATNQAPAPDHEPDHPQALNRIPAAVSGFYDAVVNTVGPLRLPTSPQKGLFRNGRSNR